MREIWPDEVYLEGDDLVIISGASMIKTVCSFSKDAAI